MFSWGWRRNHCKRLFSALVDVSGISNGGSNMVRVKRDDGYDKVKLRRLLSRTGAFEAGWEGGASLSLY